MCLVLCTWITCVLQNAFWRKTEERKMSAVEMRSFSGASELLLTVWRTAAPYHGSLLLLSPWPLTIAASELGGTSIDLPRDACLERKWVRKLWLQCLSPNEWLWRASLHCWFRGWWEGFRGWGVAFVLELSWLIVSTGMSGCGRYGCWLTGLCNQVRKKHTQGVSSWPASLWNYREVCFKGLGKQCGIL